MKKKIPWNVVFETVSLTLGVTVEHLQKARILHPGKATARGCAMLLLCKLGWKPREVANALDFSSGCTVRTAMQRCEAHGMKDLFKCIARLPEEWKKAAEAVFAPATLELRGVNLGARTASAPKVETFHLKDGGYLRIEFFSAQPEETPASNGRVRPFVAKMDHAKGATIRASLIPHFKELFNRSGSLYLGMSAATELAKQHNCSIPFIWQVRKEAIEEYTAPVTA